ncbi:conjugal transfer protein TraG [Chitinophaga parva]|uniref:Conjugal transfer protein TraG n=1 Tax=Chitinophaga parva TaxID=2169414 RepID=A0A2T7BLU6_9BACT|nr:TraG family conjugative transposon ATPase [Chitinophaga parva]PUZ28591.1 conjugal transfer protein TraG [Chitinophaga parva]
MLFVILVIAIVIAAGILLQLRDPKAKVVALDKWFPISKIEGDCLISRQGDATLAFELTLPEIFTLSTDEYEALHHTWIRAIKVLPPGTVLHKQDWFLEDKFRADPEKEKSFLQQSSDAFFHERPTMEHRCYLMLTRKAPKRRVATSMFSSLIKPSLVAPEIIDPQTFADFTDKASQFERLLSEGGFITVRKMKTDELAGTEDKAGLLERYCFLLGQNEQPLMRDISFKPEWKIGEQYCQLYSLAEMEDLPSQCASRLTYDRYSSDKSKYPVGFAAYIGQLLPGNHIYNQFISIEDTQKVFKKLEAKRRRLQSLSAYSRENAIARDATNEFLNEAISQQRQPVRAHFNIMLWTDDKEQLKDLRNKVSAALAQMDANPRQEMVGAPQLYWAGLPGNAGDIADNECFDTFTEQATCFFAQDSSYRDSVSPFGIRLVDRQSGKPVWVDISDEPMGKTTANRNKAVFGSSGSGKSMFMNHLVRSYYEQGAHIVLIDVGGSYTGLCQLLGGYYFAYTEEKPITFNPFFVAEGDSMDTEKKESIKTLILSLWKKDDEAFKRSEYVALSNALNLYFEYLDKHPNIFPCFDSFYDFLRDTYVSVLQGENVKEKHFDIDNFLYVLRPFYKDGEFGYLLNARERLNVFQQRFIVFELDNIKDHPILFSIVTLIICELFIAKMRKLKGIRKVIIIEEAWKAITKSGMAEFMRYLYKTVRKFFGEAVVVSQELDDVINSPIIREAILNNADCKILLDMRKFANKFDQIQTTMSMPDKGKPMVLSLNKSNDPRRRYRELYIELGGISMKVYGFEPSPAEYYAYTTEEKEKMLVQQYTAQQGGDMKKGIRALLADQRSGKK